MAGVAKGGADVSTLPIFIAAAVPLHILELLRQGGPADLDYESARAFASDLGERGDVLLYGGKKGEAAALANQLAHAIAVLAFLPGGITIFGQHFGVRKGVQP